VEPTRVLVADFKTIVRRRRIEDVDAAYVTQMAVYAGAAQVFPGRTVEAALIWTDVRN